MKQEGTILTVARVVAETVEKPENRTEDCLELMGGGKRGTRS